MRITTTILKGEWLTIVKGILVFAELHYLMGKHLKELAAVEIVVKNLQKIKGTQLFLSTARNKLYQYITKLSDPNAGTLQPLEGRVGHYGGIYYHPQTKTMIWRDTNGEWRSYTYK